VRDAAVLVNEPCLLSARREVKVRDQHVLIVERELLGGCTRRKVELAQ
jgi:hypothetical protein